VTGVLESRDELGADEAGRAGYEDAHAA
jgi:hypothetical protein